MIDHVAHRAGHPAGRPPPSAQRSAAGAGTAATRPVIARPGHEPAEHVDHVVQPGVVDARVHAHEERAVHDGVGVRQVADHPALDGLEGRVAQQVAAEQAAGLDPVGLEEPGQLVAG